MKVDQTNGVVLTYQELVLLLRVLNAQKKRLDKAGVHLPEPEDENFRTAVKILTLDK